MTMEQFGDRLVLEDRRKRGEFIETTLEVASTGPKVGWYRRLETAYDGSKNPKRSLNQPIKESLEFVHEENGSLAQTCEASGNERARRPRRWGSYFTSNVTWSECGAPAETT